MIRTFRNNRNETASTDGTRWWSGSDADETSIALNRLQPASELFPDPNPIVAKARSVFISALRQIAPAVEPQDDAERVVFRKAWDDATAFAAAHRVVKTGVPVFDCKLEVVGTADAICEDGSGIKYTYVYAPDGWEWGGETNALVRMLYAGFPIPCADDGFGCFTLRNLSRAVMALFIRDRTPWYAKHMAELPF